MCFVEAARNASSWMLHRKTYCSRCHIFKLRDFLEDTSIRLFCRSVKKTDTLRNCQLPFVPRPCHATGRPLSGRMALVRQMDWRGRIARACRLVEPVGASRREAPGWRCARYAYPLCALARSGP